MGVWIISPGSNVQTDERSRLNAMQCLVDHRNLFEFDPCSADFAGSNFGNTNLAAVLLDLGNIVLKRG
jgi:hypothetical protein